VEHGGPGEEKLYIIGDLGHGAHRRAGGAHRVLAVDGDGRRHRLDAVHPGAVHAVQELACIGREGLHVAPLPLGVEGVEGQRRLAAAADPRDHGETVEGQVQVEVLQVVLAGTANLDRIRFHRKNTLVSEEFKQAGPRQPSTRLEARKSSRNDKTDFSNAKGEPP
jgi:hypothetical protein